MSVSGDVLLVGSVPLGSAEDVLRTCGRALGSHVPALPDGETGDRSIWIVYQAYRVFHEHPDLETVQRPDPVDGIEQWVPTGMHNLWNFKVREGVEEIYFDDLKYASAAQASYQSFCDLRDAGEIADSVRFQVCLPTPESILVFFRDQDQLARIIPAYTDAMERELAKVLAVVPHNDLLLQWDVCSEILDIEGIFPWTSSSEPGPLERYEQTVARFSRLIPEEVQVGYHLCYADLGHQHMKEPADLGLAVDMANRTVSASSRSADYFHMPVPRERDDDDYFSPLRGLAIEDASLFLGLIHHADGLDGAKKRMIVAGRYRDRFGLATECGFGRRPASQVPELLTLHTDALGKFPSD